MKFSGDRFHAVDGEQWYRGEVVIDAEAKPARIDFTIRECNCGFVDKTSNGIFRWHGDAIEIRAPAPGDPRATEFDEESGETMRLVREGDWHGSPGFPKKAYLSSAFISSKNFVNRISTFVPYFALMRS